MEVGFLRGCESSKGVEEETSMHQKYCKTRGVYPTIINQTSISASHNSLFQCVPELHSTALVVLFYLLFLTAGLLEGKKYSIVHKQGQSFKID